LKYSTSLRLCTCSSNRLRARSVGRLCNCCHKRCAWSSSARTALGSRPVGPSWCRSPMVKAVPAILIAFEALNALMKVMAKVAMDWADTPDVRDRLTRDAAQQFAKDELDGIVRHGQRWLSEGMPSAEQIQQRLAVMAADIKEAKAAFEKRNAEFDEDDAQAAADPYGRFWATATQTWTRRSSLRRYVRSAKTRTSAISMHTTGFGGCWTVSCCGTSPMRAMCCVTC